MKLAGSIFVYGTLLDPDVRAAVLGAPASPITTASLTGWRRVPVKGELFPMLVSDPAGKVDGELIHLRSDTEWRRIEYFEGDMQVLRPVDVRRADGVLVKAVACMATKGIAPAPGTWDLAAWAAQHKARYLSATVAYMSSFALHDVQFAMAQWSQRMRRAEA